MATFSPSPTQQQVFINYCDGKNVQLHGFVRDLVEALKSNDVNVYIGMDKHRGQEEQVQLKKIVESKITLIIFSVKYTESTSCLRELAKINESVEKGKLVAIPIFFKLEESTVKYLRGQFGDTFRHLKVTNETKIKWREALESISKTSSHKVDKKSPNPRPESEFFKNIVEEVKGKMKDITLKESQKALKPENILKDGYTPKDKSFGIKQSLKIFSLLLFLFTLPQIAYMKTPFDSKRTEKVKDMETNFPIENFPCMNQSGIDKSFLTSNKRSEKIKEVETNLPPLPLSLPYNMNNYVERPIHGHGKKKPSNIQVFINFRGIQLRRVFISFLVDALKRNEINIFIDKNEQAGEDLTKLFQRIEGSGIAIVVFSSRYTESNWCLDELVKIKERAQLGLLKVLPIYYKVSIANVKKLKGEFGDHFREKEYMYQSHESKIKQWKEAIALVSRKVALSFHETSSTLEADCVPTVVEEVLRMLQDI